MPSADEYAAGYGLHHGLILANYTLIQMQIGHHQVVLYNEYSYPTDLTWQWQGPGEASASTMQALFQAFSQYVAGLRIIRTASGRPYKCIFQFPEGSQPQAQHSSDYRDIDMHYDGYGKRVSNAVATEIESGQQMHW